MLVHFNLATVYFIYIRVGIGSKAVKKMWGQINHVIICNNNSSLFFSAAEAAAEAADRAGEEQQQDRGHRPHPHFDPALTLLQVARRQGRHAGLVSHAPTAPELLLPFLSNSN